MHTHSVTICRQTTMCAQKETHSTQNTIVMQEG